MIFFGSLRHNIMENPDVLKVGYLLYFKNACLIALSLNVATMTVGFISAKLSRLTFKQALCICIESGNQNGTLAIHIAVVSLGRPDFAIAAVVYSLIMFITPLIPIYIGNKRKEEPSSDDINEDEGLSLSTD